MNTGRTVLAFSLVFGMCVQLASAAPSGRNVTPGSLRGGGVVRQAEAEEQDGEVKLKMGTIKSMLTEAPEFQFNGKTPRQLSNKKRFWGVFDVEYTTRERWTDQLSFTYHVLSSGIDEETNSKMFNYYTLTLRYADIAKGQHRSCAVLIPSQIERYGTPVALAVEVIGKSGDVIASDMVSSGIMLPRDWWKNDKVMNNPRVKVERRGGLVERFKTPFALVNPNDYEVVQ